MEIQMFEKAWPMREPFEIARGVQTEQVTLQVKLCDAQGFVGRGEACGVGYQGETPQTMMAQISAVAAEISAQVTRHDLLNILPMGGARFAIDSALWDLEAKRSGLNPFAAAGVAANPVITDMTIGIRDIPGYEDTARQLASYDVIKIKVGASDPIGAITAVRRGAPFSRFIVDTNQSWSVDMVKALGPQLKALGVVLLEQPVKIGDEAGFDGYLPEVPMCADELIEGESDLERARGRFQLINIKLDKCGGLTAALALADAAEAQGFGLMVGCMAGSSLAMAPAMVLAQRCTFVDLDGPLLHSEDMDNGFVYADGVIALPHIPLLWG